jgi:hypothetical protein
MEPMDKDRALHLFDAGTQVYLLYPDGTEAAAECREDIAGFDGLFGREIQPIEKNAKLEAKVSTEKQSVLEQIREVNKNPQPYKPKVPGRGKDGIGL